MTLILDDRQQAAQTTFESLRDRICAEFEAIEREAGSDASFEYTPWDRNDHDGSPGGGGVRGVMKGKIFEKVGVNVSTVGGSFNPEFAKTIHGAAEDPNFFATGISLVAHMANPHVPAVHMNTRYLVTTKSWFGGGADLFGVEFVGGGDVDDVNIIAGDEFFPIGLDGFVAPLVGELLRLRGVATADGLRDEFVAGGEEVVNLMEGVAVGAAHEAVADEADAELFFGHGGRGR